MSHDVIDDVPPERFRDAFDQAGVAMLLVAREGVVVRANDALARLLAWRAADLVGVGVSDLVPPGDRAEAWGAEARAGTFTLLRRLVRAEGGLVWCHLDGSVLDDGSLFVVVREAADDARDPVTGLASPARFHEALADHAVHVQRYGAEGALVIVEIDDFAHLEDRLGSVATDRLLRDVARAMRKRLRATDLVARAGGEFRVLVPRGKAPDAMVVARHLQDAVRRVGQGRLLLTCSVAVAPFDDPDDPVHVLRRAHAARDEVRRAGGDDVAAALPHAA
jgi:diguanylate cyclase (GGDEF)-like protein/PAS domain S-box-containing protein